MIEIRRNRSITCSFTCKDPDGLHKLFEHQSEEQKAMADAFEQQRRITENQIWFEIENRPIRDHFGHLVRRETHEICWEPTGKECQGPDGSTIMQMRPYIQPIKSEYEK